LPKFSSRGGVRDGQDTSEFSCLALRRGFGCPHVDTNVRREGLKTLAGYPQPFEVRLCPEGCGRSSSLSSSDCVSTGPGSSRIYSGNSTPCSSPAFRRSVRVAPLDMTVPREGMAGGRPRFDSHRSSGAYQAQGCDYSESDIESASVSSCSPGRRDRLRADYGRPPVVEGIGCGVGPSDLARRRGFPDTFVDTSVVREGLLAYIAEALLQSHRTHAAQPTSPGHHFELEVQSSLSRRRRFPVLPVDTSMARAGWSYYAEAQVLKIATVSGNVEPEMQVCR
jgi:hypothetical protein